MKKLFNHTKKSYEEWDEYDENSYDWDMSEDDLIEPQEDDILYADEDAYDQETYAFAEVEEEIYYAEEAHAADDPEEDEYYAEENENAYESAEAEEDEYYVEETYAADKAEEDEFYVEESEEAYMSAESEEEIYYAEETYAADDPEESGYYAEESEETYAFAEAEEDEYYVAEDPEIYVSDKVEEDAYYTEEEESFGGIEEYYADDTEQDEDALWHEESNARRADAHKTDRVRSNPGKRGKKKNILVVIWESFLEMGAMDRVITVTGVTVLILALVTGSIYVSTKISDNSVPVLADVGTQLESINLIGEKGLLAVADAEMARLAAASIVEEEEEQKEYNEAEYGNAVTVSLNMTSVMKDLKIKFTNKETGKLVGNVPFSVTLTTPDGKSLTWTDDDMDGIIYQKNITPGTYKVLVNALADEKYADYTLPSEMQSVEVKKDIAYEKIDVSNEVKKESEINVAAEDTKINETAVESALQDTVTWVESTAVSETYTEVSKSTIPDPTTLAMSNRFLRTVGLPTVSDGDLNENIAFTASVSPVSASVTIGGSTTAKVTATGFTKDKTLKYSVVSGNTNVATASVDALGNITITGVAAGTTTVTAIVDYIDGTSLPTTASLTVTVTDKATITLDQTTATVYLTAPITINATVANAGTDAAVTAVSSNTDVATVSVNGRVVTITGVTAGDAIITVKYSENGQEVQAACTVKVKIHPKDNRTDKLKDAAGNQLFVLENETYREAVYADYYTAAKFFIKGDVKYTGWQTIDGHVYYFTAAGDKVTGEQVIQGAKYNFASDGSLVTGSGTMGIDVSKWNGTIDWDAVKNSGVSYVIIRCGYRGSSQGQIIEDPKFAANIKGATAAGLKVGVYFFTQATDEIEAVEEASYVLDKIKNYKISYPVFLDVESSNGGRGDKIDKTTRTAVCRAFCETIQRAGYTAGVYANKTWLNDKINANSLNAYKIWLAQYAAAPTYTGRYDLWQYKSTGRVSGISGNVDMNLSYLGY